MPSLPPSLPCPFPDADAVHEINAGVSGEDPATLLECLHSQHAGLQNVQDAQTLHYLNVLKSMKAAKAEVGVGMGVCVWVCGCV